MRVAGLVVCVSGVLLALGPLNHHHAFCEEDNNHHKTSSPSSAASSSSSSSSTSSASSQQISLSSSSSSSATSTQSQQTEDGGEPHCSTCASARQHIKTMRLNAIKSQILSKLRLRTAPNISRDVVQQLLPRAPPLQRLLDQYDVLGDMQYRRAPPGGAAGGGGGEGERTGEQQYRHDRLPGGAGDRMQDAAAGMDEEDEEHAFAETIMMMATQPDPLVQVDQVPKCCLFSFRQKLQVSRVVRAQLWVHLRASDQDTTVSLQISRLMPVTADGRRRVRIRFLKMEVAAGVGSWQSIDVKQVLSGWLRQPDTNHGIEINAFDARGTDLAVSSTLPGEEGLQPFLEVKIADSPRRSRRDSGLDCEENSPESRCCRYPLMVDFEDFGWDWIIAPKRYKANYCIGECEYLHLEKYPHTHLVNRATPRGTAGPCCTPKKVSPINMLYFNDKEEIVYGKIPSMVVDRCGCS